MQPGTTDEQLVRPDLNPQRRGFFSEFRKEFVRVLVVVPIVWVGARLLRIDLEEVELIAAPVVLAWFAARGWNSGELTGPRSLPIWRFIPKFLFATFVVVGPLLLFYAVVSGLLQLAQLHDPPYLKLLGFTLAALISTGLLWAGRWPAARLSLHYLGLSGATTSQRARFAFYWLASLGLVVFVVLGKPADFNRLCEDARQAATRSGLIPDISKSMAGKLSSQCIVRRQGDGYAVTIGEVYSAAETRRRGKGVARFRVILDSSGQDRGINTAPRQDVAE